MKKHRENVEMRFSTSTKPLKEEQLIQLANFSKGKDYSKKDIKLEGHPIILYGRLYTKYQVNISDVDTLTEPKDGSIYSEGGEVIIPSSGESAEDIIRASVIENDNIIIGGDLNIIKPKERIDSTFLALSISNGRMYEELVRKAQGKSVVHIRNSDLEETYLIYPPLEEQIQIGDFFKNLDSLLTNHNTQLKKLNNLKKAMLFKMFPQDGATVPEIRFKGFVGEWERTTLGKISRITTGSSNREDSGLDGEFTFFDRSEDIRKSNIFLFDCEAIIVAGEGSDFIPKYFKGKFDLHQRTYAIMDLKKSDAQYIFYYIHLYRNYFLDVAVGSTVKSLRLPMFQDMPVTIPTLKEEQKKIGNYFKNLDVLITNHKEQLKKLNQIKKACLSKLFVSQD